MGTPPDGADTAVTLTGDQHDAPGAVAVRRRSATRPHRPYGTYTGVVAANVPGTAGHVTMTGAISGRCRS